jgi:Uma2 family endonuclease
MVTVPPHHPLRQPDGTLPDIGIYPVGGRHTMPSLAHERARLVIVELLLSLLAPGSLVAVELAVLWNPNNLRDHLLPDIMVALGAGEDDPLYGVLRKQYRIWDEAEPPDLVIELASKTTVGRDNLGKKEDYARLGVREYVQFDPLEEFLQPGLRAYRLRNGVYVPAPARGDGSVRGGVLPAYDWVRQGIYLRLRERATGMLVPTPTEARDAAEAAQAREAAARAAAEARAGNAEAEIARLRAEIARLQAEPPQA